MFGALVIAATVGGPAAAEEGIHVSPGATDSYGCYPFEVWNGDVLVRTIPASMSYPDRVCTTLAGTAFLPSGILCSACRSIAPGLRYGATPWCGPATVRPTGPSSSARTGVTAMGGAGFVGRSAYISDRDDPSDGRHLDIVATRGTPASTWTPPGPLGSTHGRRTSCAMAASSTAPRTPRRAASCG